MNDCGCHCCTFAVVDEVKHETKCGNPFSNSFGYQVAACGICRWHKCRDESYVSALFEVLEENK